VQDIEQVGIVLAELNQARKTIERGIVDQIINQIESKAIDLAHENIIMAASDEWPPGVIGLVASRLVSAYGRPTLLFHLTKDGIAKGSCRSINAFNMFDALKAYKELLLNFGGHSVAAGLSLRADNLPILKQRLEERIAEQLTPFDLRQKILLDAPLQLPDATKKLMDDLHYLEPFGHANAQPVFYIEHVTLLQQPLLLKDAHVKAQLFADGVIKPIIFFNRPDLFEILSAKGQESFDVAAQITENQWNGKTTIELIGLDIT
jgi:single-stranded-DNA-specific exonuclease